MKIMMLSDTHFGVRKGSKVFYDSQERYFEKEVIPYLIKEEIDELFMLGDIWDNRESTHNKVQNVVYHIFEKLNELGIKTTILIGNHDTNYKTNIETHSLKYLSLFENVHLIDKITEINLDGLKVTMFPWQTDDLFTRRSYDGEIAFGHFDINGCMLNSTTRQEGGTPQKFFFKNFKKTFTGHYHTPGTYTNAENKEIIYLGAPYHLTRHDIGGKRGFVILDTETLEYERVESKLPLKYILIQYPDDISKHEIINNIVDVHVKVSDKYDSKKLNKYIVDIEELDPINVNIVPHYDLESSSDEGDTISDVKSITDMIDSKLKTMDLSKEMKQGVKVYVSEIYNELKTL